VHVTLTDLEQTITTLLPHPELFVAVQALLTTLLPYLKGQQQIGRFGLTHLEVVSLLGVPSVNSEEIEQVLQPDLSFLNTTALHGVDLADLPPHMRKRFSERDSEMAEQAQQRVVKQWYQRCCGCSKGNVRVHCG
jgi:hypothetical protein